MNTIGQLKIILVLLDGLGDRSYPALDGKTPLQAARTPNLDRLAALGANGLFHASHLGECLPSEIAHYLLLGYERDEFPGRGLLEASGAGVPFDDNDVLSLAHLSGVRWENERAILITKRDDLAADRERVATLYEAVARYETNDIRFRLVQTRPNNGILVMSGDASPFVSDSDPMVVGMPMSRPQPMKSNPEPERAARTAEALNGYLIHCCRELEASPLNAMRTAEGKPSANFLATQRAGRRIKVEPFQERWGMRGALVASGSVYGGIAHELGLEYVRAKDTGHGAADLGQRIQWALDTTDHDFIHVHTKVPDEAAHKTDPRGKASAIGSLDQAFELALHALETRDDLLMVVASDHSTPSDSPLIHSGEPVPVIMAGPTIRRDTVTSYDEIAAAAGCLGLMRGRELPLMTLNFANRSALSSHRLAPRDTKYMPLQYEAFKLRR